MSGHYIKDGVDISERRLQDTSVIIKEMRGKGYRVSEVYPILPREMDISAIVQGQFLEDEKCKVLDKIDMRKLKGCSIVISPFEREMEVAIVDSKGNFVVPGYTLMIFEKDE